VEVTADNRQKVGRRRGHKTILGNAVAAASLMKLAESPGVSWAAAATEVVKPNETVPFQN